MKLFFGGMMFLLFLFGLYVWHMESKLKQNKAGILEKDMKFFVV